MRKLLTLTLASLLLAGAAQARLAFGQDSTGAAPAAAKKRGPVFRATKDQIKQAQTLLKSRGLYGGEATGKLDTPTRDGLKKYQEAEGLKVTGTLNAATLQKMNVTLTEKQKGWVAAQAEARP